MNIGDKVKRKVEDRVNRKVDQGIDKGFDKTEESAKKEVKKTRTLKRIPRRAGMMQLPLVATAGAVDRAVLRLLRAV